MCNLGICRYPLRLPQVRLQLALRLAQLVVVPPAPQPVLPRQRALVSLGAWEPRLVPQLALVLVPRSRPVHDLSQNGLSQNGLLDMSLPRSRPAQGSAR